MFAATGGTIRFWDVQTSDPNNISSSGNNNKAATNGSSNSSSSASGGNHAVRSHEVSTQCLPVQKL
jgi:hypothetical protein